MSIFKASLVGIDSAGGGLILGSGNIFCKIAGSFWAVVGDSIASHGSGPHAAATITGGSSFIKIGGIPACFAGNLASCGDTITGSAHVKVGG